MPSRCISLSKEADEALPELAAASGLNMSEYLSMLVLEARDGKRENSAAIREDIRRLLLAENQNTKVTDVMLDMFNSFLIMFATGDNEKVFYPADKQMHVWTKKAFEAVEARIEMARYNHGPGRRNAVDNEGP